MDRQNYIGFTYNLPINYLYLFTVHWWKVCKYHTMGLSCLWSPCLVRFLRLGKNHTLPKFVLQGVSYLSVFFKLTLTDRNMQVRFCLKVSVYSWGYGIWVSSTSFQKSNIGWPQKPPTENSTSVFMILSILIFFQNTKLKYFSPQIIEFKNQDDSEVLNSDFPGLRNHCSLIDLSGLCNLISLNCLYSLLNLKKLPDPDGLIINGINMTSIGYFLWNGSSKI